MQEIKILNHLRATLAANYKLLGKETDTEVAISYDYETHTLIFDFEGSSSYKDWKFNFRFLQKYAKGHTVKNLVHSGFLAKWNSVKKYIYSTIAKLDPENIIFRGYSQGGGMAIIAHGVVSNIFQDINVNTITFAAPRVWSWWHDEEIFKGVTRYELGGDPVVHLPPVLFGYKHAGNRIRLNKDFILNSRHHDPKYYGESLCR